MPKLFKVLSGKEIIKILLRVGFYEKSQNGSHIKIAIRIDGLEKVVIIPNHKEVKQGTLNNIYKDAGEKVGFETIDKDFKN